MSSIDPKTIAAIALIIAIAALGYGAFVPSPQGPQGIQGEQGPQGPEGPQGPGIKEEELTAAIAEQLSESVQIPIEASIEPRRGCTSCHVLLDPEEGKYTLSYEAHERVEARKGTDTHPNAAPDGTSLEPTSDAGVETCLLCHAADPDTGRGVWAPLVLRDIVHPAHMTSQIFKVHYGGNCFTCHNVDAEGEFTLLGEAVDTNEKGVPNPDKIPIPGERQIGGPVVSGVSLADGGQLYDKWWKVASGATEPSEDQALWSTQSTNTRSGSTTWRCKECHGWDYQGEDGAYSSGSHYTGFIGVYRARTKSVDELIDILKGEINADHDFSTVMDDDAIENLANFIAGGGVINVGQFIDSDTKEPIGGDADHGKELYDSMCAGCHGEDGKMIDFGGDYIGNIANDNPWEFLHKVRFGQPGTPMPAGVEIGWSTQDAVDVLAYSQTLPEE